MYRFFYTSLVCLLLQSLIFTVGSKAQTVRVKKENKPPKPIASFPFEYLYGGVMVIRATLDNYADSLNFILDTGSGGISLDSSTATKLGVPTVPTERTIRGIGGVKKVEFAYNHRLNLQGLSIDSLDFHVNDYELLSGVYGVKIDGIIGYSFFRRFVVFADFDAHLITVYPPGPYPYPATGHLLRPAISSLPMQYAQVGDNESMAARFYLDTGAGLCLLLSEQVVKDSALIAPGKKMYTSVAEGIGGKAEMRITVARSFKLGKYRFRNIPVYIFDDAYNITSYPFLAGLIGNDLLRRFNVFINYSRSEFFLIPNKAFREPFDYAYTGFNMYQEGRDVLIIDVMPGSPAEKAGLKADDLIISIGNKFAGTLQEYKHILQQPGNQIKMVVSRQGKLEEIKLQIGNIKKNQPRSRGK